MIVTVGNAHDAVTLTKQQYHTTFIIPSPLAYSDNSSILNSECQCRSLTNTYTRHARTYTHTNTLQSTGTCFFLTKQACFKCCIFLGYMRAKQPIVHRQTSPRDKRVSSARRTFPPPSANQPSSSLSSLGRNLYCCCRI